MKLLTVEKYGGARVGVVALRRLEARGEIRGGRFVTGFVGEQFALPEALDELRGVRTPGAGPFRSASGGSRRILRC